jgi:hypothetical protein
MHGIGTDKNEICAAAFQSLRCIYHQRGCFIPLVGELRLREFLEAME